MNMAVFFQKHGNCFWGKILRKLYTPFFLRTNGQRVRYLRDAGATVGEGVILRDVECLGSEPYLVTVGNNTALSSHVRIVTHDGGAARLHYMGFTPKKCDLFGQVVIGNNCFIGMNSVIMKNVTIGDNCFIGVGSVVTKSIPAGSVACGVPARVIGTVKEFYEKHHDCFDETVGMNPYKKRLYITEHMNKYEAARREAEARVDTTD